jgi:hypothetical protein
MAQCKNNESYVCHVAQGARVSTAISCLLYGWSRLTVFYNASTKLYCPAYHWVLGCFNNQHN